LLALTKSDLRPKESPMHSFSNPLIGLSRALIALSCAWLAVTSARAAETRTVVFLGDSLTAGYGLADPASEAYPAVIQRKIDAAGLPWRVVNAGVSGETSAGGLRRIDWVMRQPIDLLVLALGANDGLRGLSPEATRANLQQIIERIRTKRPQAKVVIAGMQMPPSYGADYVEGFRRIFPALAEKNSAPLVPFLLEGVAAQPDLNQADGIHPNSAGHARMAETVWHVLSPLLKSRP
jgi:acyl-CoA thioesterase-1